MFYLYFSLFNKNIHEVKNIAIRIVSCHTYRDTYRIVKMCIVTSLAVIFILFLRSFIFELICFLQIIGGSILIMYDKESNANAWMIDFAKTFPVEVMRPLSHRARWEVGTHEDGYLYGLDNLIDVCITTLSMCATQP